MFPPKKYQQTNSQPSHPLPRPPSNLPVPNQKQSQLQSSLSWNDDDIVDARRSGGGGSSSSGSGLQPPPAHQHGSARNQMSSYAASKPQLIPGTSSTLTPIDLSSG